MSNQQNLQKKSWWSGDPNASMQRRVDDLHRISDPGTSADEALKIFNALSYLSLAFTAYLCFFAYQSFFNRMVNAQQAFLLGLAIVVLVEGAKKYAFSKALRVLFLMGPGFIRSSFGATMMFIGPVLLAIVAFSLSVYNSTSAAQKYAETKANERTETAFSANTSDIDAQIALHQKTITDAPTYRWKKKTYYQSPKTVELANQSIGQLNTLKAETIRQQREDFERNRNRNDEDNAHAAGVIFKIGGWMEAIQVLLMLIVASCEKVLHERHLSRITAPTPSNNSGQQNFRVNGDGVSFNTGNGNGFNGGFHNRAPIGYRNTTAPPVSETDRGLTEPKPINTVRHSPEAFKQHRANFYRYRANLKNGDGNRQTVCGHLKTALDGMAEHLDVVDEQTQYETYNELCKFQEVHELISNEYVVPAEQTPLGIYLEAWKAIHNRLYLMYRNVILK